MSLELGQDHFKDQSFFVTYTVNGYKTTLFYISIIHLFVFSLIFHNILFYGFKKPILQRLHFDTNHTTISIPEKCLVLK